MSDIRNTRAWPGARDIAGYLLAKRRRWVPLVFIAAFFVIYACALPGRFYEIVDYYVAELLLLSIVTISAVLAARRSRDAGARYFLSILTIAFTSWLVARVSSFAFIGADPSDAELVKDMFYLVLYGGSILAVEFRFDQMNEPLWLQRRGAAAAGGLLLVLAIFVYVTALPTIAGDQPYRSSFAVQGAFDAYLTVRFLIAGFGTSQRPWRSMYLALGLMFALISVADGLAWLYRQEILQYQPGSLLNLVWYLWYPVAVIALQLDIGNEAGIVKGESEPQNYSVANELTVYGIGLPLLHAVGYAFELFADDARQSRDLFVAGWILVVGFIFAFFYRLLRSKLAQVERERGIAEQSALSLERQLERELRIRSLGKLAAGLAHDFGNSVTAMSLHARLLTDSDGSEKLDREVVDGLNASIEFSRELVDKLRSFAATGEAIPIEATDVGAEVSATVDLIRPSLRAGVSLDFQAQREHALALASRVAIHQVTTNFIYNAIDAIGEAGEIAVRVSEEALHSVCSSCGEQFDGSYVSIAVRDSGSGVDASVVQRIFEPLVTSKPPGEGSGLGLSMVHGVVHGMGGHVTVSDATDGCTFRAHLVTAVNP